MSDSNTSISSGLDAIFKVDASSSQKVGEEVTEIAISLLKPSLYQPRTIFDEESLTELAQSIKENGIIQPIITRKLNDDYEIIAGERRFRAAKLAGLSKIPAIIRDVSDEAVLAFALIENIQRKNLNVIEEARAYKRLIDDLKLSHDEIASRVGKSRPHITNILRLLNLPNTVQSYLEKGLISMGHARALLSLDAKIREEVAGDIVNKQLSVREIEHLSKKSVEFKHTMPSDPGNTPSHLYSEWRLALKAATACDTRIDSLSSGKFKLVFTASSSDELEDLVNSILNGIETKL